MYPQVKSCVQMPVELYLDVTRVKNGTCTTLQLSRAASWGRQGGTHCMLSIQKVETHLTFCTAMCSVTCATKCDLTNGEFMALNLICLIAKLWTCHEVLCGVHKRGSSLSITTVPIMSRWYRCFSFLQSMKQVCM